LLAALLFVAVACAMDVNLVHAQLLTFGYIFQTFAFTPTVLFAQLIVWKLGFFGIQQLSAFERGLRCNYDLAWLC